MYKSELEHRLYPPEAFSRAVRALTFPPFPPPYFVSEGRKFIITEDSTGDGEQFTADKCNPENTGSEKEDEQQWDI